MTDPTGPGPSRLATAVEAMLTTDERDAGCAATWELIDVYADLVVDGEDPEAHHPGIAAHLRSCPPCTQDYHGLLDALMTAERVADQRRQPEG